MRVIKLYTDSDEKSHFKEIEIDAPIEQRLGFYSQKFPVAELIFREFEQGLIFDWHTAPQPQYIIYLEGEVEVEASGGESRIFKPGDILFATDVQGKGHITRTLSKGRSIIITATDGKTS